MHDRHTNRERYFQEQVTTTRNFVIPYIEEVRKISSEMTIAEIGCGEGGNLLPFLDLGCKCIGIDLAANKIENGRVFFENHPQKDNLTLIAEDIYNIQPSSEMKFDVVIMRDTIEHIPNQEVFLANLKSFLHPNALIFFAFPPWRMPFGGHQQVCSSKLLSRLPYYHILPNFIYISLLKAFKESSDKIEGLKEVKDTGISIGRFQGIMKRLNYKINKHTYYFINPNYEVKFKLKTRKVWGIFSIPWLRDFYTTTYYVVVSENTSKNQKINS